jgi:hypothetical protein
MSRPRGSDRASLWERIDVPTKVVSAIIAAMSGLAALVAAGLVIVGNPFSADPQEVAAGNNPAALVARQVNRCMRAHHLRSPRVRVPSEGNPRAFRRCDWPPLTTTSTDGYSEVRNAVVYIPHRSAADRVDAVHVLRADCATLDINFLMAHMDARIFRQTRLREGHLIEVALSNGKVAVRPLRSAPPVRGVPSAAAGTFTVVKNSNIGIFDARCHT